MSLSELGIDSNATILMVDDESINMEVIRIFLQDAGYSNFVLEDQSTRAMHTLIESRPDVVLLDLNMPEVSGIEILTEIRNDQALKHLPVIILTSATDADTKMKALELGATDFLAKPVDASELALRLRNTLAAKAYQDQLANYDALTGLPNRGLFNDRVEIALKLAARNESSLAVLNIKIGRFSEVKDTLGQSAGDSVMKEISVRLNDCVRDSDSVTAEVDDSSQQLARISSDEFMLLLPNLRRTEDAAVVAERLVSSLSATITIDAAEVAIGACVGIAAYPNDGDDAGVLFRNAASAASFAEQTQGISYQFYSEEFNRQSQRRLQVEGQLRRALERNEFTLNYQPKVYVQTGKMYGVEALIRWNNVELGFVSPVEFIPIAENAGLIPAIGEWVLREACHQQRKWQLAGFGNINVAINVSVQQFHESGLPELIGSIIEESGADTERLTLEVTESVLAGDVEESIRVLKELKALGPKLSIDDFGTGYSSLSYLKQFPIDELKIDRSFIIEVESDHRDEAIVSTIIFLAHALGLKTVAEGIEEEGQLRVLRDKNCDVYQGYYYAKPMPAADLEPLLIKDAQMAASA
ncbi:MAG: putative bifunctional diguanylate cyclase/phosphodiesterase [Pseudomonadales bacterium]